MAPTNGAEPVLVHDYLLVMRGAERTFAEMAKCWPQAPISTLLYDPPAVADGFAGREVRTSYLQRLGAKQSRFRYLLPLFPRAAEHLPVSGHQVVVTSSSAFAQGVRPDPGALHVCYCHSPFRYAWFEQERAVAETPAPARPLMKRTLKRFRAWDLEASERVTHYVANSGITRERIAEIYGREADVLHPPVAVERFSVGTPQDYLLFVGQLVRHKRVEVAIEAARQAGRPIKIVGAGPDLPRLQELHADAPVDFLGSVSDAELAELYAGCAALVVPNVEEFGIAAVEAQAAGRPVVAIDRGGVRETVVDGETGILVPGEDAGALAEALRETDFERFDPAAIRAHAERFSAANFRRSLLELVARYSGEEVPSRESATSGGRP
ncbi:MAG TPA: glycosyltransferase [Solirubrobacterales bacterium]|nr:glycosyltransferase [Solirubrobacterales bacterium]